MANPTVLGTNALDFSSTAGASDAFQFTVTFGDDLAVSYASIDSSDIRITSANGFDGLATLVSIDADTDAPTLTATYELSAISGSWSAGDSGTYTLRLEPNQVIDSGGNFAAAIDLASVEFAIAEPTPTQFRVEAEDMALTNYIPKSSSSASGGEYLELHNTGFSEGSASYTFDGAAGYYDIAVGYFDENDGVASASVSVNGTQLGSWEFDEELGGNAASSNTLTSKTVAISVALAAGDVVTLDGLASSAEWARFDYMEFVPAAEPAPGEIGFGATSYSSEEGSTVEVELVRTGGSAGEVSVTLNSSDDTAVAGEDYGATSQVVTFGAGEISKTVEIAVADDSVAESDESFGLTLSNATGGATLGASAATVAIADDDLPGEIAFSSTTYSGAEGGTVEVELVRTGGSIGEVSVTLTSSDGTALAGDDYDATDLVVTFADGETIQTATIALVQNDDTEESESFGLALSNATGGATLGTDTATATIADDDQPAAQFRVEAEDMALTNYTTKSTSAASGGQYAELHKTGFSEGSASYIFDGAAGNYDVIVGYFDENDGVASATFSVNGTQLESWEFDEELGGNAASSSTQTSRTVATSLALMAGDTLTLDGFVEAGEWARFDYVEFVPAAEPAPGEIGFGATNYSSEEGGTVEVELVRTGGSVGEVSVTLSSSDDTAVAGDDYGAVAQVVTFGAGEISKTVSISLTDDDMTEESESFGLALSNATGGATLGTDAATVAIADNDQPGEIAFASTSYSGTEGGSLEVELVRTGGNVGEASVTLSSGDGTALAGEDYSALAQVVTFADGETTKTVAIALTDDDTTEESESFDLALSNATGGATLGTDTATATIADDDQPAAQFRVEAEDMALTNYTTKSTSAASGGQYAELHKTGFSEGSASYIFDGATGNYDVVVGYFDENDGVASATFSVNGTQLDSWQFDEELGGNAASSSTQTSRTMATSLALTPGDTLTLNGFVEAGEWARFDYVEFVPVMPDTTAPVATLEAASSVSDTANSFSFDVAYADAAGLDTASFDSDDIRVLGPDGFDVAASLVGTSDNTATYSIDLSGGAALGSYSIALQAQQVADINGNFASAAVLGDFSVVEPGTADYSTASSAAIVDLSADFGFVSDYTTTPKVMPMGDSITYGVVAHPSDVESGGYRAVLWDSLEDLGIAIDFVGSSSTHQGAVEDDDHNGYRGKTIDWLANESWTGLDRQEDGPPGGLIQSLSEEQPDVILLMAGTNDARTDDAADMLSEMENLLDKIAANSPNADVLVAELPPSLSSASGGTTRQQRIQDFNAALPGLIAQKQSEGLNVAYVPTGLTEDDISSPSIDNGLHPNQGGFQKISDAFESSLLDSLGQVDTLEASVQNVRGSAFDDRLTGDATDNVITGGAGFDTLSGGGGADTFAYTSASEGGDTIADFDSDDRLEIDAAGFGGGLAAGVALAEAAAATGTFVSGSQPAPLGVMANFLYDTASGVLSFDADGSDPLAAVTLAVLSGSPQLASSQLAIV